ncbi:MAG TPA: hypothetical protein VK390_15380 [Propionibacteriaceae bacterium]|nr:hypothetical protein [Propionibacteriaceae bacterium]
MPAKTTSERVAAAPAATPHPAKAVKEFTDGVCLNFHAYYTDTAYVTGYSTLKAQLADLNINCVRDQVSPGSSLQMPAWQDLAAAGIKFSVQLDSRFYNDSAADRTAADDDASGTVEADEAIDWTLDGIPNAVLDFEGPNEEMADPTECAQTLVEMDAIWAAKQADPRVASIPILSPSAADPLEYSCLGDVSAITDEGNIHSYPGGRTPEATERVGSRTLTGWITNVQGAVGADAPIVASETGYHNATNYTDANGHHPTAEAEAGKYMSQLHFAYQRRGVHRTFGYEMVDAHAESPLIDPEDHFGIVRNDLTEKPAYVALDNMMDLLADSSTGTLTPLEYAVTGAPATFKSYLLQKSNGEHWLAMWNDVKIWDDATRTSISVADVTVGLSFPTNEPVTVYRPYSSASPVTSATTNAVSVGINADVTLVKVQ